MSNEGDNSRGSTSRSYSVRRKPDGTLYRNRFDMLNAYSRSYMPYPLALYHLDYCRNILWNHTKHSVLFAFPITLVLAYGLNPDARTKGFSARSKSYYISLYLVVYSAFVFTFSADALINCDYCKPWSAIYKYSSDSDDYLRLMKDRINKEKSSNDFKANRTKHKGLRDDEL